MSSEAEIGLRGPTEYLGRCPVCGSDQRHERFESHDWICQVPGSFPLMQCDGCSCIYPDPRPTPEGLGAFYPDNKYYAYVPAAPYRLFARQELAARIWYSAVRGLMSQHYGYTRLNGSVRLGRLLARVSAVRERAAFSQANLMHPWRPDGALLDVGCGSGSYLDLMRALGWERVTGVDISAAAIQRMRDTFGIEGYAGELVDAKFPDATFDAVSMSHTLEHVADPIALLTEVARITKPGGRIAIIVPNGRSMLARLLREHWLGLETPRHLVNYSPAAMRLALAGAGLTVETVHTSGRGSYGVALFSISRLRGDDHSVYTDEKHAFPLRRRLVAATLSAIERLLIRAWLDLGEELRAVARR